MSERLVPAGALRLLALAIAYAAGVVVAELWRPAPVIALVAGAVGAITALVARARPAVLVLACALAGLRLASTADAALANGARAGADALLTGEALTDAREHLGAARFVMAVEHATIDGDPVRARERAWVTLRPSPADPVEVGARLRIDTRLAPVTFRDMDAMGRAAARRLTHRGVAARAFASASDVEVLGRSGHPLVRAADAGRAAVRDAAARLPSRQAALLLGVTIGDISRIPPDVEVDFRTTGLSHLVAVSGANVAIVLAVVALALRGLRAGRMVTVASLAGTVLAFMAITRFEPSVTRAGAMAAIALAGWALGARRAGIQALAAATVVLLVGDPFLIHNAGFQLSALATFGILVVTPRVRAALPPGKVWTLASVTLGAQLAVLPLLVLHFHRLSVVSLAANLLVEPAVAPATILGVVAAGAGAVAAPLGVLAVLAGPFLGWMLWVAGSLAQLPLASVAMPGGIAAGVVVLACVAGTAAIVRGHRPRRAGPVLIGLALIATGGVWARALSPEPPLRGLVVDMIDVGQGEAVVVQADGATMLIDGGPDPRALIEALRERRIGRIDLLVASHPHEDHVAGLVPVPQALEVGAALDPGIEAEIASYGALQDALERARVPVHRARAGDAFRLGGALVEVLWPPLEHLVGTDSDANNNSIVLRATYGSDVVLFAGETQEEAQQAILDAGEDLRARVLKVSHHGSARMVPAFYAATGAEVALIPVGPNTFGHPAPATLAALEGMRILRSDEAGDVAVALDGAGALTVREERAPASAMSGMSARSRPEALPAGLAAR